MPQYHVILTSSLARHIERHIDDNIIKEVTQKGCCQGKNSCKNHLMTNKTINGNARQGQADLLMTWIDYKRAFYSVPHSWIIEVLKIYQSKDHKVHIWNNEFMEDLSMLDIGRCQNQGRYISRRFIVSSPLLFYLALNPVCSLLQDTLWVPIRRKSCCSNSKPLGIHKIYPKSDEELNSLIIVDKQFSDYIKIEFGISKWAKVTLLRGRKVEADSRTVPGEEDSIQELVKESTLVWQRISSTIVRFKSKQS